MAHDCLGDAAEQGARHTAASVTPDDDEIGRPLCGGLDNLTGGRADLHELQRRRLQQHPLAESREQPLAVFFGSGDELAGRDSTIRRSGRIRVDDVDERQLRAEGPCQLEADVGGVRGASFCAGAACAMMSTRRSAAASPRAIDASISSPEIQRGD